MQHLEHTPLPTSAAFLRPRPRPRPLHVTQAPHAQAVQSHGETLAGHATCLCAMLCPLQA